MTLNRASKIGLGVALAVLLALAAAWAARAWLVAQFAERYFRQHGVAATVEIGALGLSGATGRFALGPSDAPELAAERLELFFDPLRWTPYLVEVRLVNPLVRARIDEAGRVTLPTLQSWLNSLSTSNEKSPYVSDDLVVSFTGLRALLATPTGAMEINGSARLVHNMPETLALSLRPGSFHWRSHRLTARAATLDLARDGDVKLRFGGDYANGAASARGVTLALDIARLRFSADGRLQSQAVRLETAAEQVTQGDVSVTDVAIRADAPGLRVANGVLETPKLETQVTVHGAEAGAHGSDIRLALAARDIRASAAGVSGAGDVALDADSALPPTWVRAVSRFPALAMEPPLAAAVARNLGHFHVSLKAHASHRDGRTELRLIQPLLLRASGGDDE